MDKNKTMQAAEEKKPIRKGFFASAKARLFTMIMACMSLMSLSAFAADGETSGGFDAVIGSFDTISTLLGKVFTLMTSNTLLALFLGVSLLSAAVSVFIMLKHAARR